MRNTLLGRFLERRSINTEIIAHKAGFAPERMEALLDTEYDPEALEVKLVALAADISPPELFEYLTKDVRLAPLEPQSPRYR